MARRTLIVITAFALASCGGQAPVRRHHHRRNDRHPLARVYVAQGRCGQASYRPPRIILICGPGTDFVDLLQWTSYGGPTAIAYGDVRIDDCNPNCAAGTPTPNVAVVALTDIVRCADGRRYYSRLGMTFTLTPPIPLGAPFLIGPAERCTRL